MSKLTPKQEKFCKEYIKTGNASEAYKNSYDAENMKPDTIYPAASRLLADCKIDARIKELQKELEKEFKFTALDAFKEFEEARQMAKMKEETNVMVTATTQKSKLFGLMTDNLKIEMPKVSVTDLTGKE